MPWNPSLYSFAFPLYFIWLEKFFPLNLYYCLCWCMETNEYKGKRHLYLDWLAGIAGKMDSGWELVSSIFPADALKSLSVCTKPYWSLFQACSDTFLCLLSLSILSSHLFPKACESKSQANAGTQWGTSRTSGACQRLRLNELGV